MKKNIQNTSGSEHGETPGGRKKILWTALFLVIAAVTVWAVVSHSRDFSIASFAAYLKDASKPWILAAVFCVCGFVFFEGAAVVSICRAFGCPSKQRQGLLYSAADIYFSGITPSATGGQPMCAYFMIRDGIPASVTTAALLVNLTLYTLSIMVISIFAAILAPGIFLSFGILSKVLIISGYVIQCLLAALFILLLTKNDLLHRICRSVLHFLCKIKLLRHEENKLQRLEKYIQEYAACAALMKHRKKEMLFAFLLNILQRLSILTVPFCVYMAAGGSGAVAVRTWAVQSYVVIGSNAIPIPGAMGVSDYIMLDGYGNFMPYQSAINLELLSRSMSFYACMILCGTAVLITYITGNRRKKNDRLL